MASFLVRVEIRDVEKSEDLSDFDYEQLHTLLQGIELERTVALTNGNFWLPDGTYIADLDTTCHSLANLVEREIASAGWTAGLVVTKLPDDAEFRDLLPYPGDH